MAQGDYTTPMTIIEVFSNTAKYNNEIITLKEMSLKPLKQFNQTRTYQTIMQHKNQDKKIIFLQFPIQKETEKAYLFLNKNTDDNQEKKSKKIPSQLQLTGLFQYKTGYGTFDLHKIQYQDIIIPIPRKN